MCTHSREPTQKVESPCLPHDNQTFVGLRTSACLEFLLSECPKANRKAKFWMKNTQIQKFLMVELGKQKVSTFLNNTITLKNPHNQLKWKKILLQNRPTLRKGLSHCEFNRKPKRHMPSWGEYTVLSPLNHYIKHIFYVFRIR